MLLVGASQGFAPNAASRVAISRTSAPQMKCCTDTGPNFGDNTYARREMLSTPGTGGELPGSVAQHRPAFRGSFGDNTAARAEMLATCGGGGELEGSVAQPTNTFRPSQGDNTWERREMLSTYGGGGELEGSVAYPTNTFSSVVGDNAPAYWGVWP